MRGKSKAWMLGPKAENSGVFEEMFLEAFRDYCYWRRNFHPEDEPYIGYEDRVSSGYLEVFERMRGNLFHMLSHLKRSIPFFSPRYVGHMNTDLLMSGLLGYFSAMLYNQNNIVSEAATITLQFETEAMRWIANMLGLNVDKAWGHLCSGGTIANIEGLWVARNLLTIPYQMALVTEQEKGKFIKDFYIGEKYFGDYIEDAKLDSICIEDLLDFREYVILECDKDRELAKIVEQRSPGSSGFPEFFRICREKLKERFPESFKIFLSRNAHYSLRKSVGILGFGEDILELVDLDREMRLDVGKLKDKISECLEKGERVLAVVGVYGSTEEGSIDNFEEITKYRDMLNAEYRGNYWIHADACYGGYAASVSKPDNDDASKRIIDLFKSLLQEVCIDDLNPEIIWPEEKWITWISQAKALGLCDSISIDPHKLGYIPYPAGAIFFRDFRVREVIRCDAPYINTSAEDVEKGAWETPFLGKYTLEGSRPGAYGAAVWLAHKTVPLDINGHGRIVAESILGARLLQSILENELQLKDEENSIGVQFLCKEPDLNIICYTFPCRYNGKLIPLTIMNKAIVQLYNDLLPTESNPTQQCKFVVSETSLNFDDYGELLYEFMDRLKLNPTQLCSRSKIGTKEFNPWRDDIKISFIRTVVMGPFHLQAMTKPRFKEEKIHLFNQYADFLKEKYFKIVEGILNSPWLLSKELRHLRPRIDEGNTVLILEDNIETANDLKEIVWKSFDFKNPHEDILVRSTKKEALEVTERRNIVAAIIDIDLPDSPKGGLEFLQLISKNDSFKGGTVFTARELYREEFNEILKANPHLMLAFNKKPSRREDRFHEVSNKLMEDLWDVLRK